MKKGFTLLEILLVIAAIGILAAIVIVAINPQRQLASVRNAKRQSDVNTINNAIQQYLIEERSYPTGISSQFQNICGEGETEGCIDLSSQLVPQYLAGIPRDPSGLAYQVAMNPVNERVSVLSPAGEIGQNIGINLFGIIAIGGNTSTVQYEDNVYTVHRFTEEGTFSLDILNTGLFDQEVRFTTTVGSTFNGIDSRGDSISPTNQGYEVVVSSGGRVDIAYPQGSGSNDIAYHAIQPVGMLATGGTESIIEVEGISYRVHEFTSVGSSTFEVQDIGNIPGGNEVEYLIVGGGGGGGASMTVCTSNHWTSGGGGAGGVLMGSFTAEDSTNYTNTVGEGGLGAVNNIDHFGFKGGNSSIVGGSTSLIALGGGGGETRGATATCGQNMTGAAGGSGGGKSDWDPSPGGLGTAGQGNNGGEGFSSYTGGGGGGAGGPGINGQRNWAGDGGPGIVSYIRGTEEWFAGGGGGGGRTAQSITRSNGGIGGGGDGNNTSTGGDRTYGVDAIPNTGGGGGGNGNESNDDGNRGRAGNGGSGIVIVRYPITAPTVTPTIQASGGDRVDIVTISGQSYRVHQFSNLNTSIAEKDFVVTDAPAGATVDVLVVGGGGAGGFGYGDQDTGKGGGGAGGVVWEESVPVSAQSYSISVGKGGRKRQHGNNYTPQAPDNGGNTTAFGFTALGGGGGGQSDNYNTGARSGGSGGGAGARNSTSSSNLGRTATQPGSSSGGLGSSGGNSGGNGNFGAGGGGGAGASGQNGQSIFNNSIGGNGGVGIDLSSYFGTSYGDNGYFAGGGGGGGYSTSNLRPQSVGGLGGGGKGTSAKEHSTGHQWATGDIDGQPTTGGGGGGSSEDAGRSPMRGSASGGGGSGTVLIRYPVSI